MPEWYPLGVAARYWGVPPWVLAEQHVAWRAWGVTGSQADDILQQKREARKMESMFGKK